MTRPAVVVMHGWASAAAELLPAAPAVLGAGLPMLFLDARGHGRSDTVEFMSMPRFAEDVEAGVAWLRTRPGIDPDRICLVGDRLWSASPLVSPTATATPSERTINKLRADRAVAMRTDERDFVYRGHRPAGEQPCVAIEIADHVDLGRNLRIAFDQRTNGRGQARGPGARVAHKEHEAGFRPAAVGPIAVWTADFRPCGNGPSEG